jgi:hypothetical protein
MVFQISAPLEDILATIWIAHGDLCSSCYVLHSAAPQLSPLEEDMGVFITAMIDEGHHEVQAGTIRGLDLRRANCESIGGELRQWYTLAVLCCMRWTLST